MVRSALLGMLLVATALCARAGDASPALELARQLNNAFIEVAEKVSPSVVVIKVAQPEQDIFSEDNPFWELVPKEYRKRMEKERDKLKEDREEKEKTDKPRRRRPLNGRGSGVIIGKDGYILTNYHVVEDAEEIRVVLRDGRSMLATVKGTDPQSDLAVIKIAITNLPVAKLGDSSAVRVGEFAVAIGAPFELDYSVTYGHVSAKSRSHVIPAYSMSSQGASMDQDYIQTDASINPGNSGGPLVNLYGEVIGINTLIRGLHTGIGFAIPINFAREVSSKLISDGKFVRSWLGVGIRDFAEDEDYQQVITNITEGVVVTSLQPGGPASKSDLKPGDVITAVDGRTVGTVTQLRSEIRAKPSTTNVLLDVVRLDERKHLRTLKVRVRPEPWPEPPVKVAKKSGSRDAELGAAELGFTARPITTELRSKYKLEDGDGVVVTEVAEDGLAATKLSAGDVIVGVNHAPVKDLTDFEKAIHRASLSKGVMFEVTTKGEKRYVVLRDTE